jgi:hypothetical protein
MDNSVSKYLTDESKFFLIPKTPMQRKYEALRAFFVDQCPSQEVAKQFGYTNGAFRVLCHSFRCDVEKKFFLETKPGPRFAPKRDGARARVIALRKQNYSTEDICRLLRDEGILLSAVSIWAILNEEGFEKLPRRPEEARPKWPRPDQAPYADVRQFSLRPRVIDTRIAGIFLLFKLLAETKIFEIPSDHQWYGSKMIPAQNAFLSSLLLKLIGKRRKSHVMDLQCDEGAPFSIGMNELPKRTYVAEYSERMTHQKNLQFMQRWLKDLRTTGTVEGQSLNLDFQSLPYFGEEDVVEKHYVSMRSRRQKAILVFFAQDAASRIFCYSNADLRKGEENDEVLRFISFWKKQTGSYPPHLVFDSKLTTYGNLRKIADMGITFVTLQRRSPGLVKDIANIAPSAWREITLTKVERKYRNPKVIDRVITSIKDYGQPIRQVIVKDLGHENPTVIITNDKKISVPDLITRYALRMLIENSISNGVRFFHTTALSSAVAIRIDFDVILTLVGQALYRKLAGSLRGYEQCGADVIFRKFLDTPGKIHVGTEEIEVRLNKRATNPILLQSGLLNKPFKLPWIAGKMVRITVR